MSPIAAAKMGLEHIVITSVDRDDLPDGGAGQFVKVIEALRRTTPATTIEILTPDFRGKMREAVEAIVAAGPDVYNHNLETVPRLYPTIRPGARYYASLRLLEEVKRHDPLIFTKSGIMLGLGEQRLEVHQVMDDMRCAEVDFITMGQYLQPTPKHAKVEEFVTPQGVRRLWRDRAGQGLPAGRSHPADPLELSRGRRFRADARRARGEARQSKTLGLMPGISETRRLPYSAEQMFDLVADVGRYAEFLPWVVGTRVRSDSETEMVADLLVGFKALREKFTSRVIKDRPHSIEVHLSRWADEGSRQSLDLSCRPAMAAARSTSRRFHLPQSDVRGAGRAIFRPRLSQDGRRVRSARRRSFTAAAIRARPASPDGAPRRGPGLRTAVVRPPFRRIAANGLGKHHRADRLDVAFRRRARRSR